MLGKKKASYGDLARRIRLEHEYRKRVHNADNSFKNQTVKAPQDREVITFVTNAEMISIKRDLANKKLTRFMK